MEPSQQPTKYVDGSADHVLNRFMKFLDQFVLDGNKNQSDDSDEEIEASLHRDYKDGVYYYYKVKIQEMMEKGKDHLNIDIIHLLQFDDILYSTIVSEYLRYEKSLNIALMKVARRYDTSFTDKNKESRYQVCFYNIQDVLKIRDMRTNRIGTLCAITGTVTRTSEVRPELLVGSFVCMDCRNKSEKIPQEFKYREPSKCNTPGCTNSKRWEICLDTSTFCDWQKLRIQENSADIPSGSMPRSLDVVLRGGAVESARAGDKVIFFGTPMVIPDVSRMNIGHGATLIRGTPNSTSDSASKSDDFGGVSGIKDLGVRDMSYRVCFIAHCVRSFDANPQAINIKEDSENDLEYTPQSFLESLPKKEREALESMIKKKNMYLKLVNSIAPSIFGHSEIKKGVLLMLFGGVHKQTAERIHIRGDINVCIVGDPSTSKSQFLKYLISFLPRTVYTSGKASSAAGLTATVVRDADTGDFNIEAGALMLADNGICCIDEFDKMDPADQVAIHEAMEQQTISIAKAGIHATLNARASILAAANPIGGRYDSTKTLRANLNIGDALMSRFDLFFIVTDQADPDVDREIAEHIIAVHQRKEGIKREFSKTDIKNFISYASLLRPTIQDDSAKLLEYYYSRMRSDVALGIKGGAYRITVRQLESLIRLSESLAKLHLSPTVQIKHVVEAARLLKKSVIHIKTDNITLQGEDEDNMVLQGEAYYSTCNLFILRLRNSSQGISQKDLLEWFMENKIDEIEDMESEMKIAKAILRKMVFEKKLLIVKNGETEDENILVVHVNYRE